VRVVGDEETAIVDAVNALWRRYTYVFTTGGIGSTHGDITAELIRGGHLTIMEASRRCYHPAM
jgi:molybdopterin-biosynthesis enzyme MoeA-like protein